MKTKGLIFSTLAMLTLIFIVGCESYFNNNPVINND